MKVDFKRETPEGEVQFSGNLNPDEVSFLVEYAITDLVKRGLMPIAVHRDPDSIVNHAEGSSTLQ